MSEKKTLRTVLAAALVLLPVAGGLTWTGVTVAGADTTAKTVIAKEQPVVVTDDPAPAGPTGRNDTPMFKQMLPVPEEYHLGPDIEGFGNDVELSSKEAEAVLRKGDAGLPGAARKESRDYVRKMHVQGMAMRSYSSVRKGLVVQMRVARIGNQASVRELHDAVVKVAGVLPSVHRGPTIHGPGHAKCFVVPKDDVAVLDQMFCTAYKDDLLVSMQATGSKLRKDEAAKLLKDQLERLVSGGGMSV